MPSTLLGWRRFYWLAAFRAEESMFYAVVRKVHIVFAYKLQNRLLPMISENGRGTQ